MVAGSHVGAILAKYKNAGALIDTNLVLLFVIGAYNVDRIATFKRTLKYRRSDFELIRRLVAWFDPLVTTPNIVTEVDNLVRQLPASEHEAVSRVMALIFGRLFERHIASAVATSHAVYPRIGITDTVTAALAAEPYLVITDDFELANRLERSGRDVVNINHLRTLE